MDFDYIIIIVMHISFLKLLHKNIYFFIYNHVININILTYKETSTPLLVFVIVRVRFINKFGIYS